MIVLSIAMECSIAASISDEADRKNQGDALIDEW